MRQAKVLFKDEEAGLLTQHDNGSFSFLYYDNWITDSTKPGVSLTLPKSQEEYHSDFLFPFFFNMLPEGSNKQIICIHHRIDPDDHFSLLLTAAKSDSIGAVTVAKVENE